MRTIRLLVSVLCITFFISPVEAKKVERELAEKVAKRHVEWKQRSRTRTDVRLEHTASRWHTPGQVRQRSAADDEATYYVFNINENDGFVIVSADDVAVPVLGYSEEGAYNTDNLPPGFDYWMECLQQEITGAADQQLPQSEEIRKEWDGFLNGKGVSLKAYTLSTILVETKWNQYAPYSNLCPTISGTRTVTGCVATAMAQIMKYHNHPAQGVGSSSAYQTSTQHLSMPAVSFEVPYDWGDMTDTYSGSATQAQNDAVATLMYHCGVSVKMDYDLSANGGSGAYTEDVAGVLPIHFGYDKSILNRSRSDYDNATWHGILKEEIDAERPILYSGRNDQSGHAFICDGYDSEGKFHFNWGWGGSKDGFFVTTALNTGTGGAGSGAGTYNKNQAIIIRIMPDEGGTATYDLKVGSNAFSSTKTSVDRGEAFTVALPSLRNMGNAVFPGGEYGVALVDQADVIQEVIGTCAYTVSPINPGVTRNSSDFSSVGCMVSAATGPGSYKLRAVVKPTGESNWGIVYGTVGLTGILDLTVTGGTVPDNSSLRLYRPSAPAFLITPDPVVQGGSLSVTFGLVNNAGTGPFVGEIELGLYDASDVLVQLIESRTMYFPYDNYYRTYAFSVPVITAAPGTYRMTLYQTAAATGVRKKVAPYSLSSNLNDMSVTVTGTGSKPAVSSVVPADAATGVPVSGDLVIEFDQAMDKTAGVGTVSLSGGVTDNGSRTWSVDGKTCTVPYSGLAYGATYAIAISGFRGDVGGIMMDAVTAGYSFKTPVPQTADAAVYSTGPYTVGNPVTATAGAYTANDGGAEGTHTYKWYRADDAAGSGETVIGGATALAYTPGAADFGKYICIETTPAGAAGLPGVPARSGYIRTGLTLTVTTAGGGGGTVSINSGTSAATVTAVLYNASPVLIVVNRTVPNNDVVWSAVPDLGAIGSTPSASTTYTLPANPTGDITLTATLSMYAAQTRILSATVSPSTFAGISYDDTPPSPSTITIANSGDANATIATVSVSPDVAFEITAGSTAVAAGGSIADWAIAPKSGLDAGTYVAVVSVAYNGTASGNPPATAQVSFTVDRKDLSPGCIATVPNVTYNGNSHTPSLTVTEGGRTLAPGTDYTAICSYNTDAGTATVVITGIGNYTGTAIQTFEILKAETVAGLLEYSPTGVAYDGSPKSVAVSAKSSVSGLGNIAAVYYDGSPVPPTAIGNYTVTVDIDAGSNYNAKTGLLLGAFSIREPFVFTWDIQSDVRKGTQSWTAANDAYGAGRWYSGCEQTLTLTVIPAIATEQSVALRYPGLAGNYLETVDERPLPATLRIPAGQTQVSLTFRTRDVPFALEGLAGAIEFTHSHGIESTPDYYFYNRPDYAAMLYIPRAPMYAGQLALNLKGGSPDLFRSLNGGTTWEKADAPVRPVQIANLENEILLKEPHSCYEIHIPIADGNGQEEGNPAGLTSTVWLPILPGAHTIPTAGNYPVVNGKDFVFILIPQEPSSVPVPLVTTGRVSLSDSEGVLVTPNEDGTYTVTIRAVREFISLNIGFGTASEAVPGVRVWSAGRELYIASPQSGEAMVYTLVGHLVKAVSFAANRTSVTTLPAGVYAVVTGDGKVYKVIVRD